MTPYELLIELRENKILYEYLSDAAVRLDVNDDWFILGNCDKGTTKIVELSTKVLRITLPIPMKVFIPPAALHKLLESFAESVEGLLEVELEETPVLMYQLHTTFEGLNDGLLNFVRDRKLINRDVQQLSKTLSEMMQQMNVKMENVPDSSSATEESGENLWSVLEEIDQRPDEEDGEPSTEPEE